MESKKPYFRLALLFAAVLCAAVLCACAAPAQNAPAEPTAAPAPTAAPTPVPAIDLGGTEVPADIDALSLADGSYTVDLLCASADRFTALNSIELGLTGLSGAELARITAAYPTAEVTWRTALLGEEYPSDTAVLDLSALNGEELDAVCEALEKLPALRSINTIPEQGVTTLSFAQLDRLQAAAPDALLDCRFDLYGQLVSFDTEELRYSKAGLNNDAVAQFRAALPYLRALKLLRVYNSGIDDYDGMLSLKEDFPEVNIVWSVNIAGYNFMTDTVLFHCPLLRDKHVELLRYLPDVLYLDVGHNQYLTSIDFVRYFPKLTTIIISITHLSDISALADCPDLEFFEAFSCPIKDISPLAGLTKLEYVNLGDCPNLQSLAPLRGMTTLKLVRLTGSYPNFAKNEISDLSESIPDCFVSTYGGHSAFSGYWRFDDQHNYTERYALLRQQMLYDIPSWEDRQQNSPTRLPGDRER